MMENLQQITTHFLLVRIKEEADEIHLDNDFDRVGMDEVSEML